MAKRIVLAAFACAAIGLCAWILWLGAPAERGAAQAKARPEGGSVPPERGIPVPIGEPGTVPRAVPAPGIAGAARDQDGGGGEGRSEPAPALVDEDGITLRIVGPQGEPLERAEVLVMAEADDATLQRFRDPAEVDALMESAARAQLTDATGTLRVPAPRQGRTLVLARSGNLWGSLSLARKADREEPVELALQPDVTLRVRVVDRGGASVSGVGVQVLHQDSWGSWPACDTVTKGDPPLATLRHVQDVLDDDPAVSWALGLDVLFQTGIEHALDPSALPQEVVTLVLPDCGSVEVAVFADDRQPFKGQAQARLGIVREGEPDRLSPFSDIRRPTVKRPVVDGVARFLFVEPGRRLAVAVSRGGSSVESCTFGAGPGAPGQARTLDVVLGSDHPVALLRAVDDAGDPLAGTDLGVRVVVGGKYSSHSDEVDVHTDSEGAFLVDLDRGHGDEIRRELIVSSASSDGAAISGRIDVPTGLRDGVNDLGFVRLEPPPLFVAGRVVSSTGAGLPDVKLVLDKRHTGRSHWTRDWQFDHRTDEAGAFLVRGIYTGDDLRIGASLKGHAGPLQEFRRGDDGVLIELDAEGALAGRVLLDEGFPRDALQLRLTGDIDHLDYSDRNRSVAEDGSFHFEGLLRGEHGLTVRFEGQRRGAGEFTGIPVMVGETTRDPRLDPLDLRGRFHAHHVALVVPEEGAPGPEGQARFGPAGAEQLESSRWFHEPEFWLVAGEERIDLEIRGAGYLSERLEDVGGEIRIALKAAPAVRLVLAADAPLPEPPVYIKASLTPTDDSNGSVDWGAAAFDEGREISVRVSATGEMRVTWVVERRGGGSNVASSKNLDPPQLVTVTGEPDQRIDVHLTAEQLEELVGDG